MPHTGSVLSVPVIDFVIDFISCVRPWTRLAIAALHADNDIPQRHWGMEEYRRVN
jgi:hypothetical protein